MRYFTILLLLVSFMIAKEYSIAEVEALVQAVKTAPKSERYKHMNALKKALRSMNKQMRALALKKLQSSKSNDTTKTTSDTSSSTVQTQKEQRLMKMLQKQQMLRLQSNQQQKQNGVVSPLGKHTGPNGPFKGK